MSTQRRIPLREFVPVMLFMTVVLLAFATQVPAVIVATAGLCAVYAWAARSGSGLTRNEWMVRAMVCLLFLPAFVKPHHGLSPIFYFLATVAAFSAAMAAARKAPEVLLKAFEWIYLAAVVVVGWVAYTHWGEPEPLGMVIKGSSTNAIPAYLIVLQISLSLAAYLATGRLPVLSPFITFAVAFIGNGRGSLVVAALIIAATLLLNVVAPGRGKLHWRLAFLLGLVLAVSSLVLWGEEFLELVTNYTKLSVGLVDTNRLEIWDQYSEKIDGPTLLFGGNYAGTIIEHEYGGNPHIAYIRTHSFFGLPLTLLAMISPAFVLLARKTLAAKAVFFTFISLAALRAYSEPIFFPTLLDFFYFTWFLMYFNYAPGTARARAATTPVGARHHA